ncbi:C-type lectin domain family 10 member A isoform X2 [Dunckerocampus dactyliophorus]|uniref:C-type lectin domain family 10 member A isoform X2 n=1 Tax=Dunckerocampus dactyliophorus TaxID=161453 RepID=UPI002406B2E8|nr:C-type lectin domain family 10 member A isoform X2 [Dunckerocampus dactyliophorus]
MTTEYHDDVEEDSSSFWTKVAILVLTIVLGASYSRLSSLIWSVEKNVSNVSQSLQTIQQLAKDSAKDVERLKFAVESNKQEITSASEALKQLATLDTISRAVASLKCSIEHIINNGSTKDGCCPVGWQRSESSCYFFSRVPLSWHDARDWCNGHESHLAILQSDAVWEFVHQHMLGLFHWIGLSDETGKWEWVNHTPYVMNRRHWRPGQPDSWIHHGLGPGDEDCAHIHTDGRLNDLHCSSKLNFICQRHST